MLPTPRQPPVPLHKSGLLVLATHVTSFNKLACLMRYVMRPAFALHVALEHAQYLWRLCLPAHARRVVFHKLLPPSLFPFFFRH